MDMSHDEQRVIVDALCNPLNPRVAVNLCSTCQGLCGLMHSQLQELRERHRAAVGLCSKLGTNCHTVLNANRLNWRFKGLGPPECQVVGMLFRSFALPALKELHLDGNPLGEDGMVALAAGLVRGALPSLTALVCIHTELGNGARCKQLTSLFASPWLARAWVIVAARGAGSGGGEVRQKERLSLFQAEQRAREHPQGRCWRLLASCRAGVGPIW